MRYFGADKLMHPEALPYLERGTQIKYEGSIDKRGGNADWDWWLYEDNGEWVIFDVSGPGCIYNFVQHRYISSPEVEFRFYFDGEASPRFSIRASEFGEKYPFIRPVADKYIGPLDSGRGPIRVVRSFVPMPYRTGCRITSNIKLEGASREKGEGGWGHVAYHSYAVPDGIVSFSADAEHEQLQAFLKTAGERVRYTEDRLFSRSAPKIAAGECAVLAEHGGAGVITGLRLLADMPAEARRDIWIRMRWDGHDEDDVCCPLGAFTGNEEGHHDTRYLLTGSTADGCFYSLFPMPFWQNAKIMLENRGEAEISFSMAEVYIGERIYERELCGYFKSSPYYERKHTEGADSIIGCLEGSGKLVAAQVTCYGERSGTITCEGDVRVHIDGSLTPQVESDGSESYVCYGWGFPTPAETHPFGGYDGLPDNPWSMLRLCVGDSYPFYDGLRFGIESGECNDQHLEHSGVLLYYGGNEASLIKADVIFTASDKYVCEIRENKKTEELSSFFEGDDDHACVSGTVCRHDGNGSFTVKLPQENAGIRLRRRSDQAEGRQCARVLIDGIEVDERLWYYADRNPHKRWLEDEFDVPSAYTDGKSEITVTISPQSGAWNAERYEVFYYCS